MVRIPPFSLDPSLVECPICAALVKHSNMGRHATGAHEIEIEQRLANPSDPALKEFAELGFTFTKKD